MSDDDWGNSDEENVWEKDKQAVADWEDDEPTEPVSAKKDSWEEDEPQQTEAKQQQTSSESKGAKTNKKDAKPVNELEIPLSDPLAEKLRLKKLQERAEDELIDDTFGDFRIDKKDDASEKAGAASPTTTSVTSTSAAKSSKAASPTKAKAEKAEVHDTFVHDFHFETTEEIKKFCGTMLDKLDEEINGVAICKKPHMKGSLCRFLITCLTTCAESPKLTRKDLEELDKKLKEIIRTKKVEQTSAQAAKNKINDTTNKHKQWNAADELDEMYGEDWDEEWDEEWDENAEWNGSY